MLLPLKGKAELQMPASGIGFASLMQKSKPPVSVLPQGTAALPTPPSLPCSGTWLVLCELPTQLTLPRCDHRPTSPTLPLPTRLPRGWAPPPHSGTYRHIKLPLHLSFGTPSLSAGLTTAEARCFPASMRGSVPRARGGDRLQPAHEPPFMRPSEAATLQALPFPPPQPLP